MPWTCVPTAAAMCMRPESLLTACSARASTSIASASDVGVGIAGAASQVDKTVLAVVDDKHSLR